MTSCLLTLLHLAVTAANLCRPGGVRAVIAENLLLKQQLLVLRRGRRRAPNLTGSDRLLCGFASLFLSPSRIQKVALALRPSTLLAFHQALVQRKYRRLFSSAGCPKKPGPKGPDESLVRAIVSLWSVDLFRCESVVLRSYWVLVVMDQFTRRLVGFGVHGGPLTTADVCRLFNAAIHGQGVPCYLSTDHDPLFEGRQWMANLRVLGIEEVKTVPHVPSSHPFLERLIGTIRREFLDQVLFWNGLDLERKLTEFRIYYNAARRHASLAGHTPLTFDKGQTEAPADLNDVRWVSHCRGLVQLPVAA